MLVAFEFFLLSSFQSLTQTPLASIASAMSSIHRAARAFGTYFPLVLLYSFFRHGYMRCVMYETRQPELVTTTAFLMSARRTHDTA